MTCMAVFNATSLDLMQRDILLLFARNNRKYLMPARRVIGLVADAPNTNFVLDDINEDIINKQAIQC